MTSLPVNNLFTPRLPENQICHLEFRILDIHSNKGFSTSPHTANAIHLSYQIRLHHFGCVVRTNLMCAMSEGVQLANVTIGKIGSDMNETPDANIITLEIEVRATHCMEVEHKMTIIMQFDYNFGEEWSPENTKIYVRHKGQPITDLDLKMRINTSDVYPGYERNTRCEYNNLGNRNMNETPDANIITLEIEVRATHCMEVEHKMTIIMQFDYNFGEEWSPENTKIYVRHKGQPITDLDLKMRINTSDVYPG
ncbi:hypothetical protein FGIG_02918 [Fasciola gigantica]|uniref:Uncharacterized protein n=1 Tax=Fasciola gigantica TaxID=46835 RepID=A0A504Z269_FASGI|nr:hypothetical protein FGIG_02918 [Fasciola gigantica]